MSNCNYRPSGNLKGDSSPMPNRGTGTGYTGKKVILDGMSTGIDDINRLGSAKSKVDSLETNYNHKPTKS